MAEKSVLPTILSVMAGYVDTAGFLALHGLFTAHVTGNFVTIGAALVSGASGVIAKLLALPVFCVFVIGARLLRYRLMNRGVPVVPSLLAIMLALFVAAMILALYYGPFPRVDSWSSTITGMILVGAMAIQNAVHRVHLPSSPPSTLMTGTTTQMMLDIGDRLCGAPSDQTQIINSRLKKMGLAVLAFAIGCAGGALFYAFGGMWCFVVPPVLAAAALMRHADAAPAVAST